MDINIVSFLFRIFAIIFSALYLVYAVVIFQQTRTMSKTMISSSNSILIVISFIQIIVAMLLLFGSFFI